MKLANAVVGGTVHVYDNVNGRRSGRKGYEMPVVKVTRQTVYVESGWQKMAFDRQTGRQKQDSWCHHEAWMSEQDRLNEETLSNAWQQLTVGLYRKPRPDGVTVERIHQLMDELGVKRDG